ncbi:MAG: uroporphyrinogen-III C-methyltransferase [Bacteroidota bacterium]
MTKEPKLTLVGAGPGDPELITVKGMKALQNADVVLYDALVHPDLLEYAPQAVHISVGKRAGKESVPQDKILELIRDSAFEYGHVVRLKGGDPFVFARGFEELEYATRHGIKTDIVLGISSIMLPGLYGIPLTCRGVNHSFTVVTATTSEGLLSDDVFMAAEKSPTTIFFMGLGKIDQIAAAYKKFNREDLPVAILSRGSHNDDGVLYGNVSTIESLVARHKPKAPALLVFGECADLNKELEVKNCEMAEELLLI